MQVSNCNIMYKVATQCVCVCVCVCACVCVCMCWCVCVCMYIYIYIHDQNYKLHFFRIQKSLIHRKLKKIYLT